jgi:serine/threonine-protein kinase HipA
VEKATSGWRQQAAELGLSRQQIDRMTAAYESDQRRFARGIGA